MANELETMYQQYLDMVKLDEKQMPSLQKQEIKRAFHGGCSQILVFLKRKIGVLPEDEAIDKLTELESECLAFWDNEIKQL